jgi:hypothetical protein
MAAPLQMEWVFASCDTEHSASAARVKFGQIAPKARSLPAVCRCQQMDMFVPYHDIKRASDRMAARRKSDRSRASTQQIAFVSLAGAIVCNQSMQSTQAFVTSGNRCMALRRSSVVRCVYWRETAALSCPTISRAKTSERPDCIRRRGYIEVGARF